MGQYIKGARKSLLCKISIVLIGNDLIIHNRLPSKEINPALINIQRVVQLLQYKVKAIYSSIIFYTAKE